MQKARCATLLKNIEAVYIPIDPIYEGGCGTASPVQLMALGKNPQVVISPPAVVTCDMVAALHGWLQKDIQPSARKLLGSPIVKIENMSSYSCRNAYGRAKTRLSEHGRANALDIRGFLTASGQGADLLADWGPTMRDARAGELAAAKAAAIKAAALKADADRQSMADAARKAGTDTGSRQPVDAGTIPGGVGTLIEGVPRVRVLTPGQLETGTTGAAFGPQKLGGPRAAEKGQGPAAAQPKGAAVDHTTTAEHRRQKFLRDAHASACRTFNTVLGPEANNAHRNHFHVDMAERSSGPFCE